MEPRLKCACLVYFCGMCFLIVSNGKSGAVEGFEKWRGTLECTACAQSDNAGLGGSQTCIITIFCSHDTNGPRMSVTVTVSVTNVGDGVGI